MLNGEKCTGEEKKKQKNKKEGRELAGVESLQF